MCKLETIRGICNAAACVTRRHLRPRPSAASGSNSQPLWRTSCASGPKVTFLAATALLANQLCKHHGESAAQLANQPRSDAIGICYCRKRGNQRWPFLRLSARNCQGSDTQLDRQDRPFQSDLQPASRLQQTHRCIRQLTIRPRVKGRQLPAA